MSGAVLICSSSHYWRAVHCNLRWNIEHSRVYSKCIKEQRKEVSHALTVLIQRQCRVLQPSSVEFSGVQLRADQCHPSAKDRSPEGRTLPGSRHIRGNHPICPTIAALVSKHVKDVMEIPICLALQCQGLISKGSHLSRANRKDEEKKLRQRKT